MLINSKSPTQTINEPIVFQCTIQQNLTVHQFLRRQYYNYNEAMQALGLSTHTHQLSKRIENYPNEIITVHCVSFISIGYFNCLAAFQKSVNDLLILKNGGVQW